MQSWVQELQRSEVLDEEAFPDQIKLEMIVLKFLAPLLDPDGARSDEIDAAQANYTRLEGVTEHAVFDNIGDAFDTVEQATAHLMSLDTMSIASKGRIALATRGHDAHRKAHDDVASQIASVESPLQRDFMTAEHESASYVALAQRWADVAGIAEGTLRDSDKGFDLGLMHETDSLWKGLSNTAVKRKLDNHYAVGGIERVVKETGWRQRAHSLLEAQDRYELFAKSDVDVSVRRHNRFAAVSEAARSERTADLKARVERVAQNEQRAQEDRDAQSAKARREAEAEKSAGHRLMAIESRLEVGEIRTRNKVLEALPHELAEAKDVASKYGASRRSLHRVLSSDRSLAIDFEMKGEMSAGRRRQLTAFRRAAQEHNADPLGDASLAFNREMFERGVLHQKSTRTALMAHTEIAEATRERDSKLIEEGARNWMGDGKLPPEKYVAMNTRAVHMHIVKEYGKGDGDGGAPIPVTAILAAKMALKHTEKTDMSPEQCIALSKGMRTALVSRLTDTDAIKLDIAERASGLILETQERARSTKSTARA